VDSVSKPKKPARRLEKPSAHPAASDAAADAFGKARLETESAGGSLQTTIGILDRGWEGILKTRFLESLRLTSGRMIGALIPQLQSLEEKYHDKMK
jgi:uncharacterized protein YukE